MELAYAKLLALVTMFCLAGCSPTLMTPTGGIDREDVSQAISALLADICSQAWLPVTYSSRDTSETQLEVRASNAARAEICED